MMNYIYFLIVLVLLNACIPGENPVQPYDRGDMINASVSMGEFYSNQLYFSLDNNTIVAQNLLTDWDIGFACQDGSFDIIMNYGKFMSVYELESVDFNSIDKEFVDNLPDEGWRLDDPKGNLDSTAIGKWWEDDTTRIISKGLIYIIDRGFDEKGKKQGVVKFRIDGYNNNSFNITFANVKYNINYQLTIDKAPLYNFVQLSFDDQGYVVQLEPPRDNWDLLFSSYTEQVYSNDSLTYWYGVTGAYINHNRMASAFIVSDDFQSIDATVIDTLKFSRNRNSIGHEWKEYDLQNGVYVVYPKMTYIIHSVSGFFYKLHFTDFYDKNGAKGTPNFEYQKL